MESLSTLRGMITLKKLQRSQRFQWYQRFKGRAEIDALVYELYGLTKGEITIVGGLDHE